MGPFESVILSTWLDRFRMVKPQRTWQDSGNGILYSAVFILLTKPGTEDPYFYKNWFKEIVQSCYKKPGCLMRTPENSYGQQQWDDYLGVAAASIHTGDTSIPRSILWYGIKHFFIFDNDGKIEGKDWLGRSVHLWILMLLAAFPWLVRWPFRPFVQFPLWIAALTMDPNITDASGTQLQWVFMQTYSRLFNWFDGYSCPILISHTWRKTFSMYSIMKNYYDSEHPFLREWALEDKSLGTLT